MEPAEETREEEAKAEEIQQSTGVGFPGSSVGEESTCTQRFSARPEHHADSMLGMIKNSLFGIMETWPWQVLSKGDKGDVSYEERACEGGKFATVEVTDKPVDEALREAMPKVMKYVGGSNDKGLRMGMTVPISFAVFPSDDGDLQKKLKVWFRIPNKFQSDPPAPSYDSIKIEDWEGITVYSMQFGGYAKAADYAAQAAQLRSALEGTATYQTDFYFCTGYDPPMKPCGRGNEVCLVDQSSE